MLKKVWSYPVDFCIRFRIIPDNPTESATDRPDYITLLACARG